MPLRSPSPKHFKWWSRTSFVEAIFSSSAVGSASLLQHSAFSDSYEGIVWSKNISRVGYVLLGDDVAREWGYDQAKCALHRIIATTLSFRLMEMACHPSYPLNSENASPPGTFTVYLSCAEMALPTKMASTNAIMTITQDRTLVIAHSSSTVCKFARTRT